MAAATTYMDSMVSNVLPHEIGPGLYGVRLVVTLATTQLDDAGDKIYIFPFPRGSNVRIWDVELDVADLDSDGTPTLQWDLVTFSDLDGTVSQTLISNSTVGQSAGQDSLDAQREFESDVAGEYLGLNIDTAAATAASGDMEINLVFSEGVPEISTSATVTKARVQEPGEDNE